MLNKYMKMLKIAFVVVMGIVIVLTIYLIIAALTAQAATNISSSSPNYYAWNDITHWLDFYNTNTVNVYDDHLDGYASSTIGPVSFDCATAPNPPGSVCGQSNYGVYNDGSGNLTGWAWNDYIGWLSFCGGLGTGNCPGSVTYRVIINTATGDFNGWAWNDTIGWICFSSTTNGCTSGTTFKVNTAWRSTSSIGYLISEIFDTQKTSGATLNSIIWQGDQGTGNTCVNFQVATSSCSNGKTNPPACNNSGDWIFNGPGGAIGQYYSASCASSFRGGVDADGCADVNVPICVNPSQGRYLRYKVQLKSNDPRTSTPIIRDVILNWSR